MNMGRSTKGEEMTPEQEKHLHRIKANFTHKCDVKYREGQREHGGDLMHDHILKLINKSLDEAIDLVVYLETLRESVVGK